MMRIEGDIFIAAPPARVFEMVADERNEPRYNPRIVRARKISSGPIGVGTRFTAEPKGMGRSGTMTVEIMNYEPPNRLATSIRASTMDVDGTLTFTPEEDGTRLRWSWRMRLNGAARLAYPLMHAIGPRWERRNWVGLKRHMEGHHDTVSLRTRIEHEIDSRSVGLGAWLYRRTGGRITRLWGSRALILTTVGRRTGLSRTVLLQYFPDGADLIVVAANSGLPTPPGWYFNLTANTEAVVEVDDRSIRVHADELSQEEAASFWPRVLDQAPDYAKYASRTSRRLPLLRLCPVNR